MTMTGMTDCDERVVKVEVETRHGQVCTQYAIYDAYLGYWRGVGALTDYDAWTRDTARRATFSSRAEAARELMAIRQARREHDAEAGARAADERIVA